MPNRDVLDHHVATLIGVFHSPKQRVEVGDSRVEAIVDDKVEHAIVGPQLRKGGPFHLIHLNCLDAILGEEDILVNVRTVHLGAG
jgi:hypothetical protein